MPRLSLWRENRQNDYRFIDKTIREMYTVGGIDIHIHKYLGPKVVGDSSIRDGDATKPVYDESNPLFIEDLLFLENRDRAYDPDVYTLRGVYNVQDIDFDLTQFGLFLNGDTLFITFHYNDMIDLLGRKLMSGDVIEVPNLKDYHPLNSSGLKALPKYYVIQDASYASEGFSQTWLPHLWRVKATPLTASQEYDDILNRPIDDENPAAGTLVDLLATRGQDLAINDAILAQAEEEVPLSGHDVAKFYITPTDQNGLPAASQDVLLGDSTTVPGESPKGNGWTVGYLTGDGVAPNGLPVTPGVSFPTEPTDGDYCLRLDYFPNRLFRFNGKRWIRIEDNVRTTLTPGANNKSQRSQFINNTDQISTSDRGLIPSRQMLSDILKPKADN